MKLEDQVCSLDLAKKLKELGIKQDSQFYHVEAKSIGDYSAFTVAELGTMLRNVKIPSGTFIGDKCYMSLELLITINKCELIHGYDAGFSSREDLVISFKDEKEADSRAKMLIYLIENKLIEV